MSTGVRVTGLRETQRKLKSLGVQVADLKEANARIAGRVVDQAKTLTPVRSGALRDSIRASKAQNKITIRGGSARTLYASFVEYGGGHNSAVGMVTRAVTDNQDYAVKALEHEIESLIKRYDLN